MAKKWGVVVVHGVGDTGPGITVDAFLTSLTAGERNLRPDGRVEVHYLPDWGPRKPDASSDVPVFPVHIRRAAILTPSDRATGQLSIGPPPPESGEDATAPADTPAAPTPSKAITEPSALPLEAVFAEVFWADLSRIRDGSMNLILSLVSTIFSLRFLTGQAAVMPHDGNGRAEEQTRALARWLRFLLHIAASILCGPVAALSIFLASVVAVDFLNLSHLFARPGEEHVPPGVYMRESWAILILSIVAAVGGLGARCVAGNAGSGTTWRRIWSSLAVVGTACGVVVLRADWIPYGVWLRLFELLPKQLGMPLEPLGVSPVSYWKHVHTMEFFASILLVMLHSAFYLLAFIMLAALVVWLVAIASAPAAWRPALGVAYGAALVQLGLWLVLVPVLGLAAVFTIFKPVSTNTSHAEILLRSVQRSLALHLAFLMIVSAVAAFVWFCRSRWSRTRSVTWKGPPYDYPTPKPDIPRLLVHRSIVGTLVVVGAFGSALSLVNLVWAAVGPPPPSVLLYDIATQLAGLLVSFLILISTLVLPGVRAWLHILVDVINHFYRRRERLPLPFGPEDRADVHDFEVQKRIECRFRAVLEALVNDPEMTHLTVVAHSQGTMIAVDVFSLTGLHSHNRKTLTERLASLEGLHLITMGSPLTHLYQHYFPYRYPPLDDHCWGGLKSTIKDWVNVYRIDDFVGTFVGPSVGLKGGEYPANVPIEPGGHTAYWRRPSVYNLEILRNRLPGYSSPLQTTGQAGMLAVFAEFERDFLRDRVKAGIAQARKEGRTHGRPPTIAKHSDEVIRLFQEGVSKREIARRIGISRASVRNLLGGGNP